MSSYVYLKANESGTHNIYYTNANTSSYYRVYFYIYNVTQNYNILSNTTVNSSSYYNVSFNANAGDVIYIRMYRYNTSYTPTARLYFTGFSNVTSTSSARLQSISYTYDENYTLPTPTKDGYTFEGWYKEDGTLFALTSKWEIDEDITLIAKFTQDKS